MKKIFFTAATMFALLHSFAQTAADTAGFKSRKLKVEEINLVSSYYNQNGNNAAVTGGIGTEKLTDIANVFDVKLIKYDNKYRKHSFDLELGIDHYTSASSDRIDLKANSSASSADTRIYPSINWSIENEKKRKTFGLGVSSSTEFDYQSFGANINFAKKTKNKNGEFTAKVQAYLDQVSLVLPIELRVNSGGYGKNNYPKVARNTFAASISYSQIINEKLNIMFIADAVQQNGYLSLPFHRVYFYDSTVHQEKLPSSRFKIPLGFRANYFLGDKFIIKTYYRFYKDDWGITAHTANIELPIKLTPFISVSPFYRYYTQTAAKFFGAYKTHSIQDQYYTSNYDMSNFNSSFMGAGIRLAPPTGVFGLKHLSMLELRYGHYSRTTGLNANIISMNLKFK